MEKEAFPFAYFGCQNRYACLPEKLPLLAEQDLPKAFLK